MNFQQVFCYSHYKVFLANIPLVGKQEPYTIRNFLFLLGFQRMLTILFEVFPVSFSIFLKEEFLNFINQIAIAGVQYLIKELINIYQILIFYLIGILLTIQLSFIANLLILPFNFLSVPSFILCHQLLFPSRHTIAILDIQKSNVLIIWNDFFIRSTVDFFLLI
ncbi:unnamed protein product [Paramecium pentaurelia]|uniref:Uncharacterized protein n=1 Tax=Paramecium pentaurelia TaxID=43138 RepID=A0A8S1XUR5_9CILI|nr:unnamed protein product [Paramecium pentaurelia]